MSEQERQEFDLLFAHTKAELYSMTIRQLIDSQIAMVLSQNESMLWRARNAAIADELSIRWRIGLLEVDEGQPALF